MYSKCILFLMLLFPLQNCQSDDAEQRLVKKGPSGKSDDSCLFGSTLEGFLHSARFDVSSPKKIDSTIELTSKERETLLVGMDSEIQTLDDIFRLIDKGTLQRREVQALEIASAPFALFTFDIESKTQGFFVNLDTIQPAGAIADGQIINCDVSQREIVPANVCLFGPTFVDYKKGGEFTFSPSEVLTQNSMFTNMQKQQILSMTFAKSIPEAFAFFDEGDLVTETATSLLNGKNYTAYYFALSGSKAGYVFEKNTLHVATLLVDNDFTECTILRPRAAANRCVFGADFQALSIFLLHDDEFTFTDVKTIDGSTELSSLERSQIAEFTTELDKLLGSSDEGIVEKVALVHKPTQRNYTLYTYSKNDKEQGVIFRAGTSKRVLTIVDGEYIDCLPQL